MIDLKAFEIWFVTGSQSLYGQETLDQVAAHSQEMARFFDQDPGIPVRVVCKPTMTRPDAIHSLCLEANAAKNCVGIITWMHTFSPAKMWIAGLSALKKPFLHLHTQYNREIPWDTIDMDYMNLNQSAHGDREYGFIGTRLRLNRKVVVGFWQDADVLAEMGVWMRAAVAWADMQGMRVARFGDNMREVAVTEGDKVEAQIRFGYDVYGYGIGDLVDRVQAATDDEVEHMLQTYHEQYAFSESLRLDEAQRAGLREAARIEVGMRAFLEEGNFKAFTTNFEDLHHMAQLPGLAVQRLMADGYGFGGEGDWKTAALVRAMKVMGAGLPGGASFMEDYTYHLSPTDGGMKVLGAHMLEVCPSIAAAQPVLEMHPLGIGGKADPARLVFTAASGPAVNASVIDMGNRFRMIVNAVDVITPSVPLPQLPVARALWIPQPSLKIGAAAWIYAGGAHHAGFSQAITAQHLQDFANMAGIEFLLIDQATNLDAFQKELRWNEMYYALAKGL